VSFRNSKGSWFINAIASIFAKKAATEHVADMITVVSEPRNGLKVLG